MTVPCKCKCDVIIGTLMQLEELNNLQIRGIEGSPIEGGKMDQNHHIGTLPQNQGFH